MASQDRTSEFFSLCQSLPPPPPNATFPSSSQHNHNHNHIHHKQQQQQQNQQSHNTGRYSSTSTSNDPSDELKSFHQTASLISRDIYTTSTLLSQLTTLIHSRSASIFVDETPQVNNLVLQIKSNIETLNLKLENAQQVINRNKRALNANAVKSGGGHGSSLYGGGNNSQKFTEVNNLVGQLQEEFVNTTKGFKDVLRVRSDRMKERTDRRNNLMKGGGASSVNSSGAKRDDDDEDLALLGNKPKLYDDNHRDDFGSGMMKFSQMNDSNNSDASAQQGGGGFGMGGPRLDLTSAIMSNQNEMGMPGGESTMQLPRPCKFFFVFLSFFIVYTYHSIF